LKPFFGFIKQFLIIVTGFIIVTIVISWMIYENNKIALISSECTTPVPEFFCGTVTPVFTEIEEKGRELFLSNCAECHRLNKRATGPALSGVLNKNYPSKNYFEKFIVSENSLKGADKLYSIKISKEYNSDFQHTFLLSETEIEELKAYLK